MTASQFERNMSITQVSILEANKHLMQLHKRVYELENKIDMQSMYVEELETANQQLQQQLQKATRDNASVLREKEDSLLELNQRLDESDKRVQLLLQSAQERDLVVEKLERKARLFYEVVEQRSVLVHMLSVLDELCEDGDDGGGGGGENGMNEGGGGDNSQSECGGGENGKSEDGGENGKCEGGGENGKSELGDGEDDKTDGGDKDGDE